MVPERSIEHPTFSLRMGQPWFECRQLAEEHGLIAMSADHTLCGDMSDRMMSIAAGLGPSQEIYSIDESFIDLTGIRGDVTARARLMRERILEWIPVEYNSILQRSSGSHTWCSKANTGEQTGEQTLASKMYLIENQ